MFQIVAFNHTVAVVSMTNNWFHHLFVSFLCLFFSLIPSLSFLPFHVVRFSDLLDLWVIKIKKAHDPLRKYYVEIT